MDLQPVRCRPLVHTFANACNFRRTPCHPPVLHRNRVAPVPPLACQSKVSVLRWLTEFSPCHLREVAVGPLILCHSIFVAWFIYEDCFPTHFEPCVASAGLLRLEVSSWCSCPSFSGPGSCCILPAECCGRSGEPNRNHCHLLLSFSGSSSLALRLIRPFHWIEGSVD